MRYASLPTFDGLQTLARRLGVTRGELDWFADHCRNLARGAPPATQHYRWHLLPKRSGGWRCIEAPKPRMLRLQRWILRNILEAVPPSEVCFGFVAGRSCLDHARQHVGAPWLVALDLNDWFGRIDRARVHAQFAWMGYAAPIAAVLTRLCTTRAPSAFVVEAPAEQRNWLRTLHLPQGAPTSPALANLVTARLDRRLLGYARAEGLRYSRYADDLAFSPQAGALAPPPDRVIDAVTRIARSEGFAIQPRKTRVRRQSDSMRVCGSVINDRLNAPRAEYDLLRAAVHRYTRDPDPLSRAQLIGKLGWLGQRHPRRAEKLLAQMQCAAPAGAPPLD